MPPAGLSIKNGSGGLRPARMRLIRYELNNPSHLSSTSNRTEAQVVIRDGIRRGVIRVVPLPGCPTHVRVVRVVPAAGSKTSEDRLPS